MILTRLNIGAHVPRIGDGASKVPCGGFDSHSVCQKVKSTLRGVSLTFSQA